MSDEQLKAAGLEVDRSRQKLIGTLQELTRQFEPHRLMEEAWEKAKGKGADLAEEAVDAVRARPLAATGVVAGIVAFLAREPLMDLAGKAWDGVSGKRRKARKTTKTKHTETVE